MEERILFPATKRLIALGETADLEESAAIGTDGKKGSGAYDVDSNGETTYLGKPYTVPRAEGVKEKIIEYTLRAFE